MSLLLERFVYSPGVAFLRLLLHPALCVLHSDTAVPCDWLTEDVALDLAVVGELRDLRVIHLDVVDPLDLGDGLAVGPHSGEVHLLLHDVTLLPGDGAALLLPCPHLVPVAIHLPVSDTVVLGG